MSKRPGVTLMEVLVAIFIMGIGMLAMLVLFPLGVLRMAAAIQADRCAQACRMASVNANYQQLRNDPWVLYDQSANWTRHIPIVVTNQGLGYTAAPTVSFSPPQQAGGIPATGRATMSAGQVTAIILKDAGTGYTQPPLITLSPPPPGGTQATAVVLDPFSMPSNQWTWLRADPHGPSYPVFVDPMGYASVLGQLQNQYWLAGTLGNNNTIPRRTSSFCLSGGSPTKALALRWTCLLDELPFVTDSTTNQVSLQYDGVPSMTSAGTYTRNINYNWAYLLRRPRTSDLSVVNVTVVVYSNRPILSSAFNEYLYQNQGGANEVSFDPVGNTITIDVSVTGNIVPPCRPGDWLLDASYVPSPPYGSVNGYFYRVVGVTQNSETSYTFEVQQPLRNMTATMSSPGALQKIMFLEGVAEVFEKGPGWLSAQTWGSSQ